MATVFISHVEEDQPLALDIAGGLERAGYTTWYYERDSSPGLSYLLQVNAAIEACQVVVLIISPQSLDSAQVTAEVVRAHETGKSFVPVRTGVTHDAFRQRKPDWSMAVGAAASIAVPATGAAAILSDILEGLALLSAERQRQAPLPVGAPASAARRRVWPLASGAVAALAVVLLALYLTGPDEPMPSSRDASPTPAGTPPTVAPPPLGSPAPSPAATPATPSRRTTRERVPRCAESTVGGARRVQERGRLEARDDVNSVVYRFVICEQRNISNGTVEMEIRGSETVGTKWSSETAAKKAQDMELRGVECEPTGVPAVRSTGAHDPRSIVFVLCQESGMPTSIAVHATTRKADASAYPEKVLRASWPR